MIRLGLRKGLSVNRKFKSWAEHWTQTLNSDSVASFGRLGVGDGLQRDAAKSYLTEQMKTSLYVCVNAMNNLGLGSLTRWPAESGEIKPGVN